MFTMIALALTLSLQSPQTQSVTSKDGTRVAYDVTGSGPTIILLHGGGQEFERIDRVFPREIEFTRSHAR
jgi:pimeloyl-ACP methyl ester carboxylesterase